MLPDLAVKQVTKGAFKGQAGAFATKAFKTGNVISCYAGKLEFSDCVREQAGKMINQVVETCKWPPARGHPLIESVLATNFEWGPVNSDFVKLVLSREYPQASLAAFDKQLVIMPYPNYGNQSMAVNEVDDAASAKRQQNCTYITVNYKGFPYIFLVALSDIRRGEELRCIVPTHNEKFHNRKECDNRLPGLVHMLSSASGIIPLTDPPVEWEHQLCARKSSIYIVENPKVAKLRQQVEEEWAKRWGDNVKMLNFEDKVEIVNKISCYLDENNLKDQLRAWLEPEGPDARRPTTTWNGEEEEAAAEEGAGREKRAKKAVRDPSEPKRPRTSYFFFLEEHRRMLLSERPDLTMCEITKLLSPKWNALSLEEKAPYEIKHKAARVQYDIEKVHTHTHSHTPTHTHTQHTHTHTYTHTQGTVRQGERRGGMARRRRRVQVRGRHRVVDEQDLWRQGCQFLEYQEEDPQ